MLLNYMYKFKILYKASKSLVKKMICLCISIFPTFYQMCVDCRTFSEANKEAVKVGKGQMWKRVYKFRFS